MGIAREAAETGSNWRKASCTALTAPRMTLGVITVAVGCAITGRVEGGIAVFGNTFVEACKIYDAQNAGYISMTDLRQALVKARI